VLAWKGVPTVIDFESFFNPKSAAIVGASHQRRKVRYEGLTNKSEKVLPNNKLTPAVFTTTAIKSIPSSTVRSITLHTI